MTSVVNAQKFCHDILGSESFLAVSAIEITTAAF
jgi:hypothetical protein